MCSINRRITVCQEAFATPNGGICLSHIAETKTRQEIKLGNQRSPGPTFNCSMTNWATETTLALLLLYLWGPCQAPKAAVRTHHLAPISIVILPALHPLRPQIQSGRNCWSWLGKERQLNHPSGSKHI